MPDQPRPEDFGLEVKPPKVAGPKPEDFGLEVLPEKTINEAHPKMGIIQQGVVENLTANQPALKVGYLQKQGFEAKELPNGEVAVRMPGEADWYKTKKADEPGMKGILQGLWRLTKTGMALAPSPFGAYSRLQDIKEGLPDLLTLQGEGAKLGAASVGAAVGGTAGLAGGPAGSAALGTAGAFAGGTAAQDALLRLGQAVGVPAPQDQAQLSAKEGAMSAGSVAAGNAVGGLSRVVGRKVSELAPKAITAAGKAMEKPLLWKRKVEDKSTEALRTITGEEQAEKAAAAAKDAKRAQDLDDLKKLAQKAEQERLQRAARASEETAVKADATVNQTEFTKEAGRLRDDIANRRQKIRKAWADLKDDIQANKAMGNALDADEVASMKMELKGQLREDEEAIEWAQVELRKIMEKARETGSRKTIYQAQLAKRNAMEKAGVGGMKEAPAKARELPTLESAPGVAPKEAEIPQVAKTQQTIDDLIHNAKKEVRDAAHKLNQEWAQKRAFLGEMLAKKEINRQAWLEENQAIADEVHATISEWHEGLHTDINKLELQRLLSQKKVPTEGEMRQGAEGIIKRTRQIPELPSESEILYRGKSRIPEHEEAMREIGRESAREVLGSFRAYPHLGKTSYYRLTGEGLAKSSALAGYGLERLAKKMAASAANAPNDVQAALARLYRVKERYGMDAFGLAVALEIDKSPQLQKWAQAIASEQ